MAHERKRHLASLLAHVARLSPLVGLIGHRQVGKTTLLQRLSRSYLSLDDEGFLRRATEGPKAFIDSLRITGTVIDECQLAAGIFPALKERVRKDKRPGQFYLSGSVRFTSKKLIRESLTGRIMNLELLPLTLSELDGVPLPDALQRLLAARRLSKSVVVGIGAREHARRQRLISVYESHGGLPGACFIRDSKLRTQKIIDQLETVLDRDLRQIHETTLPLPEILRFTRELALHDGSPIRHESLRRATGITPPTQKKLLFALEAAFVLRHIPIEGDFSGSALFFEDHAEVATLARTPLEDAQRWNGLVYRNLREQAFYRLGENLDFFQYRTRAGVLVPFAVRGPNSTLAFIPVHGAPTRSDLSAARSFLGRYADSRAILVTDGSESEVLDDRTAIVPATWLLF